MTPSHQSPERPQDAMAIWVDDLTEDSFKVCLREVKIFDGFHQNIKIVSTCLCKVNFVSSNLRFLNSFDIRCSFKLPLPSTLPTLKKQQRLLQTEVEKIHFSWNNLVSIANKAIGYPSMLSVSRDEVMICRPWLSAGN